MKKTHMLTIALLCWLIIGSISFAIAQDETPEATPDNVAINLCFDLSEGDCAIIDTANANNANIISFNHDFTLNFTASGLDILELLGQEFPPAVIYNAEGNGAFGITENSTTALTFTALATGYQGELPEDAPGTIMEVLNTLDADANSFDLIQFTLLDNQVYTRLNGENISLPLSAIVGRELPLGLNQFLPISPETILNLRPQSWGDVLGMVDINAILAPGGMNIDDVATYQRLDDQELMGQAVATFEFRLDVGALINTPEFTAILTDQLSDLSAQFDNPMMGMAIGFLPLILPGVQSEVVVTQYVGTEDNFVHRVSFQLDFLVDLGMLTRPDSEGSSSSISPFDMSLDFELFINDINDGTPIIEPENVRSLSQTEIDAIFNRVMGN